MEDDVEVLGRPPLPLRFVAELDALVGANRWDVLFTDVDYRVGAGRYVAASGAAKRPDMDCSREERFSDKYTKTIR